MHYNGSHSPTSSTLWGLNALDNSPEAVAAIDALASWDRHSISPQNFPELGMEKSHIIFKGEVRIWRADNIELVNKMLTTHATRVFLHTHLLNRLQSQEQKPRPKSKKSKKSKTQLKMTHFFRT